MGIELGKDTLVQGMKTVGKLITNKVIAMDTSYLKVSYVNGSYWLAGFGSQHELLMKLQDTEAEETSKNIDFDNIWDLVGYMGDEIFLELTEKGVFVKDETSKTELVDVMSDNDDVEDIGSLLEMKDSLEEGFTVNREEFYNTVKYLRGIQEREDREDLETGVMLSTDAGYVVSELYAARVDYEFPINLVLDTPTVKVLLDLLESNHEEENITIVREEGLTWFLIGEDIYRVDGLTDEVDEEYKEVFNHRDVKDTIQLDKTESLRMLNMTKVLTDSLEPDINLKVEKGKGRIYTETNDGDLVDSKFNAKKCQDTEFTVSVENMISVISNIPNSAGSSLEFEVVLIPEEEQMEEQELLHLKVGDKDGFKGDCIFSINTDI